MKTAKDIVNELIKEISSGHKPERFLSSSKIRPLWMKNEERIAKQQMGIESVSCEKLAQRKSEVGENLLTAHDALRKDVVNE